MEASAQDRDALLRAARRCVDLPPRADLAHELIAAVQDVVPCDRATYYEVVPPNIVTLVHHPPIDVAGYPAIAPEEGLDDPAVAHAIARMDTAPGAVRWSDVVDVDELRKTPFYRAAYAPLGVRHQLTLALPTGGPHHSGVVAMRTDRDFSDREVALLDQLQPHLRSARDLAWLHDGSVVALSEVGAAIALLEPSGAVVTETEPFARLVDEWARHLGGARASITALPPALESYARRPASRFGGHPSAPMPAAREASEPLEVPAGPRRLVGRLHEAGRLSVLALEVVDDEHTISSLARELDLTPRQAEVALLVAMGRTDREIATHLDVTPGTVRSHLRTAFRRLGVTSRQQAAAAVAAVPGLTIPVTTPRRPSRAAAGSS